MNHPASSFRAKAIQPWHRELWPWLLMAGPFAVVLASFASAWIAVRSDDGVVAQDYYKQGLLINQKIRRTLPTPTPVAGATLSVTSDGRVHVHLLEAATDAARMQITFVRPRDRRERRVDLALSGDEWIGTLPELSAGRWIVALATEVWQLPTTIVDAPFTELRLGSPAPH